MRKGGRNGLLLDRYFGARDDDWILRQLRVDHQQRIALHFTADGNDPARVLSPLCKEATNDEAGPWRRSGDRDAVGGDTLTEPHQPATKRDDPEFGNEGTGSTVMTPGEEPDEYSIVERLMQVARSVKGGILACLVKKGTTPEQVQDILGPCFGVEGLGRCWDYSGGVTVTFSLRWVNDELEAKVVNVHWQPPWHCWERVEDLRDNRGWERIWFIDEPAKP